MAVRLPIIYRNQRKLKIFDSIFVSNSLLGRKFHRVVTLNHQFKLTSPPQSKVKLVKMEINYPDVKRDESVIEEQFGVKVADPYRWLEDPDTEETKQFVDTQNSITRPYLHSCQYRDAVNKRLKELWDYPKYSCPAKHGNFYFFYKNSGLQNQSVLYKQTNLDSEPEVFLDPNLLSDDGTVSLSTTKFSEDGRIFAYGLSSSGSDWITIQFKKVATGENYPEVLKKVKFSAISWTHDNKGVFYASYPDQAGKVDGSETVRNEYHKLFYHRLGTEQAEDILVVEFPDDPLLRISTDVSDCGRYLLIHPAKGCRDNLIYYSDLEKIKHNITGKLEIVQVVKELTSDYEFIANTGPKMIYRTNRNAPNYRLIVIDFENPDEENWNTLIAEDSIDVLDWAAAVNNDKLVICYIHHVKNILQYYDLNTGRQLGGFPLDVGTISGFSGKKKHTEIFYQFINFLTPGVIYRCDLTQTDMKPEVFREIKVSGFVKDNYVTQQVFYNSRDGCRVPMFIVHKKDVKRDGNNPCLLYGYGGFNVSIQPVFSVTRLVFIQHLDGVLAVPNIRGGGEYGEKWHNSGRLLNKQNVFDDFQSAGQYLIKEKYTSSNMLTIHGGSNGGLLVGACINQRPDLFACAISQVGVMDMLRYHKFTIGHSWTTDYGSPDEKEHFENLYKYSPLHNVRMPEGEVQYPATLLLTSDHDDRVVPLHSLKFIAQMQHVLKNCKKQTNPVLIRIETKSGHGGGKPTSKIIDESTDILSFIILSLGLQFKV